MHQPLSNFPRASIVRVYIQALNPEPGSLRIYIHLVIPWKLVFFIPPASLPSRHLPSRLLPAHSLSVSPPLLSVSTLWTLCISFISAHIIPIPTLSSAASAHTPTAHPLLWISEAPLLFWIPFLTQMYRTRVEFGDLCAPLGCIICIACVAYKQ